jgi:hypothetical protein
MLLSVVCVSAVEAVLPDLRVLLDLHEGADLGVVPDLAAVEVDEVEDPDVPAQLHIVGD